MRESFGINSILMTSSEVQSLMLRLLASGNIDARLGRGEHYLAEAVRRAAPEGQRPTSRQIMEAVWSLVGQGLAYIDLSQTGHENWTLHLSSAGDSAAKDEGFNPDDPAGYMRKLLEEIPSLSATVKGYADEALRAYNAGLYRSSAVMLGVASEAAVLEVARSLALGLPANEGRKYLETIDSQRQAYLAKFDSFRKKLQCKKNDLPDDLADGLDLTMSAVADLLRIYRNDAGHPTAKHVQREDCFIHLRMFVRYAKKLYDLKSYLEKPHG